ncbi:MAG TPA: J domain-containing protein [Acidobacteriaceae bacterium]|jgi:hypothetical protein|nr:J domain-containing protein [Acidobacteriaceae bacterium]
MDAFWPIDQAPQARVRGFEPETASGEPSGAGAGAPFLAQIEQVLGHEMEPDAAFFVDSWTMGVAAASENFLRRQDSSRSRASERSAWDTFSFSTPYFVPNVEAPVETAWPLREARAEQSLTMDLSWQGDEEDDDGYAADEAEIVCPNTFESACRVLGVTATSTRGQIRAAYRRMASRYHPDRLVRGGPREQQLASDRMASINEAYRLLCAGFHGPWSTCS